MRKAIPFSADCDLGQALSRPLSGVSLIEDKHGFCYSVTLWHGEDGITITSTMQDAAPRAEVGVLNFERSLGAVSQSRITRFGEPRLISRVSKMLIDEAEASFESGIRIDLDDAAFVQVLPGGFPLTLIVSGVISSSNTDFEYPEKMYRLADLNPIAN